MFVLDDSMRLLLMVIGAVTIIGAVMMAMVQHNLRRLLSFHAVSQVGYMVLGIGTGVWIGVVGGLFHMLNNAIYKCALFLVAGSVEHRTGTTELDRLGGLARVMPVTFGACLIAALAISGIPPFNGFVSKWMIYRGVLASTSTLMPLFLVAAIFGSALTLASFVKVIHSIFWGRLPDELQAKPIREVGVSMVIPMVVLAALCVIFGIFWMVPVNGLIAKALTVLEQGIPFGTPADLNAMGGMWSASLATLLILVGLAVGLFIYFIGTGFKVREGHTFVGGELLEGDKIRYSGTSFYDTIRQLPVIGAVYKDAEHCGPTWI